MRARCREVQQLKNDSLSGAGGTHASEQGHSHEAIEHADDNTTDGKGLSTFDRVLLRWLDERTMTSSCGCSLLMPCFETVPRMA
jgi:hypothetical protein